MKNRQGDGVWMRVFVLQEEKRSFRDEKRKGEKKFFDLMTSIRNPVLFERKIFFFLFLRIT
jgi:hypothetical protein